MKLVPRRFNPRLAPADDKDVNAAADASDPRRGLGARAAVEHALVVLAPVATILLLVTYIARNEFAVDFQHTYWPAGLRILHGLDPYTSTRQQIAGGIAFVYPPLAGFVFGAFALLSRAASAAVFTVLSMLAALLTLRALSVRDWRVYAVAFVWFPVINAWQSANLTLLLGLLIALTWRYRRTPAAAGLLAALAVSLKPFVWPLGLWLLATRRYRAAAWALASGLAINLIAFAVLGFRDIDRYVHMSAAVTTALYRTGYGVIAIAVRLGVSRGPATAPMVLLAVVLAGMCLHVGRQRRDHRALVLAVVLMLVASPLVWNHYFALLIVALAVSRPRLSAEWLLGLLLWACPSLHVAEWQALLAAAYTGGITLELLLHGGLRRHVPRLPKVLGSHAAG